MGGLGQGLVSGVSMGHQIMQAGEELKLRKQEATLREKLFQVQLQQLQRDEGLRSQLGQLFTAAAPRQTTASYGMTETEPAGQTTVTEPGQPVDESKLLGILAQLEPKAAAEAYLKPMMEQKVYERNIGRSTALINKLLGLEGEPAAAPPAPMESGLPATGAMGEAGGAPFQSPSSVAQAWQQFNAPGGTLSEGRNTGMLVPGNIDLTNRPRVRNPDGSISTVRSMSFQDDRGREVLIPTVSDDGRILTSQQAIDLYHRTGKHLGIFSSPRAATEFAQRLHRDQEGMTAVSRGTSAPGQASLAPRMSFVPSISVNKDGTLSVTIQGQRTNLQRSDTTVADASGRGVIWERIFDPSTGRVVFSQPLGPAPLPAELQQAEAAAASLGYEPGTEAHRWAVGRLFAGRGLSNDVQEQILADLERQAPAGARGRRGTAPGGGGTLGGGPAAGGGTTIGEAIGRAQARRVGEAEQTTRAREQVQRSERPPEAADRQRLVMYDAVIRQGDFLTRTFRPQFVGKGFNRFREDLKREWERQERHFDDSGKLVPGGIAGAIREWTGNISPQEVQFRRTILDLADLILRARSGMQINERERQDLRKFLVSALDEPNVFVPSLRRLTSEAQAQRRAILEYAGTGTGELMRRGAPAQGPMIRRLVPVP